MENFTILMEDTLNWRFLLAGNGFKENSFPCSMIFH